MAKNENNKIKSLSERKKEQQTLINRVKKTTQTLQGRGYKFNSRTMSKVMRLTSKDGNLTPAEKRYLEQFRTIEKGMKKAKSFEDVVTGKKLSKTAGKAYTTATNKAIKLLEERGISKDSTMTIINAIKVTTNPEAFTKSIVKEGIEYIANAITNSVGLGDLGSELVDIVSSTASETSAETQGNKNVSRETKQQEQQEQQEQPQQQEQQEQPEQEFDVYGFDTEEEIELDYEETLIEELENIRSIYFVYSNTKNGVSVPDAKDITETGGYVDVSELSQRGIDYIQNSMSLGTDDEREKYMDDHPYSIFSIKLVDATEPIYTDDDQYIYERYEEFIEWLQ